MIAVTSASNQAMLRPCGWKGDECRAADVSALTAKAPRVGVGFNAKVQDDKRKLN